jgi:glycine cleavage system H lipoate-binding protein
MEGFTYVDIFATKGIEYILVIGFLIVFIVYWRFLDSPLKSKISVKTKLKPSVNDWFNLAKNVYYHPGHSWVLPVDKDTVKVGIDDFAQKLIGKPDSLDLPAVGSRIEQGETGWRIQSDSKSIDLLSPVAGEVVAVNEKALISPELIERDPYDKGWILKVKVAKMRPNLKNLLSGNLALAWMENTVKVLRERMSGELGVVIQDGGLPVSGFAKALSPDKWDEIAAEFFLTK